MSSAENSKQSRASQASSVGRSNPLPTHVTEKGSVNLNMQGAGANSSAANSSTVSESANARLNDKNDQPRPMGFVRPPSPAELGIGQNLVGRWPATETLMRSMCRTFRIRTQI